MTDSKLFIEINELNFFCKVINDIILSYAKVIKKIINTLDIRREEYIIYNSECYFVKNITKPYKRWIEEYGFYQCYGFISMTELFTNKKRKIKLYGMPAHLDAPIITEYWICDIYDNGILSLLSLDDSYCIDIRNNCFKIQNEIKILLDQGDNIIIKLLEYDEINKIISYKKDI
jgi:hypothetical protein